MAPHRLAVVCALALAAACSSGGNPSGSTTTASAEPHAQVELTGADGLTGPATDVSVRCSVPDVDGLTIAVLATAPDRDQLVRIAVRADDVRVIVSTGAGDGYRERTFRGAGVTAFDPASGAEVDSDLAEVSPRQGRDEGNGPGVLDHLSASVDCGSQTVGSSTVTITGSLRGATLTAATLDPVRVECDLTTAGYEVFASGLLDVDGEAVLVTLSLTTDGVVTFSDPAAADHRQYAAPGVARVTPRGAQLTARVVAQDPVQRRVIELDGALTCGRHADG